MELPSQSRSQMEFGNEEASRSPDNSLSGCHDQNFGHGTRGHREVRASSATSCGSASLRHPDNKLSGWRRLSRRLAQFIRHRIIPYLHEKLLALHHLHPRRAQFLARKFSEIRRDRLRVHHRLRRAQITRAPRNRR